tara:strand:- start:2414 stop:2584 length:171 start_codon:yes stop_codon:yes gene_type:complete
MKSLKITEKEQEWIIRALGECSFALSEEYSYEEDWSHPNQKDMDYLDKLETKIQRL